MFTERERAIAAVARATPEDSSRRFSSSLTCPSPFPPPLSLLPLPRPIPARRSRLSTSGLGGGQARRKTRVISTRRAASKRGIYRARTAQSIRKINCAVQPCVLLKVGNLRARNNRSGDPARAHTAGAARRGINVRNAQMKFQRRLPVTRWCNARLARCPRASRARRTRRTSLRSWCDYQRSYVSVYARRGGTAALNDQSSRANDVCITHAMRHGVALHTGYHHRRASHVRAAAVFRSSGPHLENAINHVSRSRRPSTLWMGYCLSNARGRRGKFKRPRASACKFFAGI